LGGVASVYTKHTHSTCIFEILALFYNMVKKLPKDILKAIANAEFLERWNGKEWEKVPVDPDNPKVQEIKMIMMAEVEINVIKEALELGILHKADRDLD